MNDVALSPDTSVLAAISGASPAGRDLSYDPQLEAIGAEVEKATSLAAQLPDWRFVRDESARVLREESKDLRAASWLVVARAQIEGWTGAAEGIVTYQALVEAHWDTMFPPAKRARARAALVSWLWENLAKALAPRAVTAAEGALVRALVPLVTALDGALATRLGDANPGVGALRSLLREKAESAPQPVAAAAPPAPAAPTRAAATSGSTSAGATPASASAGATAASSTVAAATPAIDGAAAPIEPPVAIEPSAATASAAAAPRAAPALPADAYATPPTDAVNAASLDDAEAAAGRFREGLATLARQARSVAPTSPWPYRLARVSAWLTIDAPPAVENGKTYVRAPRAADRSALAELERAGQWEALRDAAEDALSEHIFWLDVHRASAIALERLGPAYAAARATVGREVAGFVQRVSGVQSLAFANGTPFASPDTQAWIAQEAARFAGGGRSARGASGGAGATDDGAEAALADARARCDAGDLDGGLAGALAAANDMTTARGRFRARLGVAQLAAERGKTAIALALFERLLPEANDTLEAWEPALCAELLEGYLKASRAPDSGDTPNERRTLLFRRLLSLDPAAALRIWG